MDDFLPLNDDDGDDHDDIPCLHSPRSSNHSDDLILDFDSPSPSENGSSSSELSLIASDSEEGEEGEGEEEEEGEDWILQLTDDDSNQENEEDDDLLFTPPDSPLLSGMDLSKSDVGGDWFGELSLVGGTTGWNQEGEGNFTLREASKVDIMSMNPAREDDNFEPIPISPLLPSFRLATTHSSSKKRSTSLTSSFSSSSSHRINRNPPKKFRPLTPPPTPISSSSSSHLNLAPFPTSSEVIPTKTTSMKVPTQEEMDAFFGFVDHNKKGSDSGRDVDGISRGCGTSGERVVENCLNAEGRMEECEMGKGKRKGKERVVYEEEIKVGIKKVIKKKESKSKKKGEEEVYQLGPIPKFNLITGQRLLPEERRLFIISSLEKLTLSVLSQLINSVSIPSISTSIPEKSSTTKSQGQPPSILPTPQDSQSAQSPQSQAQIILEKERDEEGSTQRKKKNKIQPSPKQRKLKPKPIVVILAKRGGGEGRPKSATADNHPAIQDQNQNQNPDQDQVVQPTQRILFPRNGKSASRLPAVLKTIEILLEGLNNHTICTKRDLFYKSVGIFKKQSKVDSIIEDIAATLNVRREELNVVAASKGLFGGFVKVHCRDGVVLQGGNQGALIPPGQSIERVEYDQVKWVLIIEKEAVFHTLCHTRFLKDVKRLGNGILLTGKGYPDIATREFVKRLSIDLPSTPLLCLVDSDPHGLEILSTYKFGSLSLSFDRENLAVESVEWIGVKGSEWDGLGVDRKELLELSEGDRKKALKILGRRDLPKEWRRELQYMLHLQRKAEIQVLSSVVAPRNDDGIEGSQEGTQNLPLLFKYLLDKISEITSLESGEGETSDLF